LEGNHLGHREPESQSIIRNSHHFVPRVSIKNEFDEYIRFAQETANWKFLIIRRLLQRLRGHEIGDLDNYNYGIITGSFPNTSCVGRKFLVSHPYALPRPCLL